MLLDTTKFYAFEESRNDVLPGPQFDAWRLRILPREELALLSVRERLAYFACWALLAPTSHNTVPQRFRLHPESDALGLWLDRSGVLPESDPAGRQASVSLGCVLENAALAAEAYGFSSELDLSRRAPITPAPALRTHLVHVATARFTLRTPAPSDDLAELLAPLKARKMVRAVFDEQVKLDPELGAQLVTQAQALHSGLTLHLLTDAPTKIFLGKFQELADTTVINRESFARELGAWLLPNTSSASLGMCGREFGLADAPADRMHRGLLGEGPLLPDETAGFAKVGSLGMRSASAIAVICVAQDDLEHRLAAGRAFERLAITLQREGFVTAMHAGITEVEAPNLALRGRLRTRQRPTVVFRIGKPLHPEDGARPHSARPALNDLLLSDGAA